MKLDAAKAECERWFGYLDRQREKSLAMQKIATAVRTGEITSEEGQRRVRTLDGRGLTVYDGANLEKAVRVLLRELGIANIELGRQRLMLHQIISIADVFDVAVSDMIGEAVKDARSTHPARAENIQLRKRVAELEGRLARIASISAIKDQETGDALRHGKSRF